MTELSPIARLNNFRLNICSVLKTLNSGKINFVWKSILKKQEDPLRSYSLVFAIVCLFVLIIVLKFVGNEQVTTFHNMNNKNNMKKFL